MGKSAIGNQLIELKNQIRTWKDELAELKGEQKAIVRQLRTEFSLEPSEIDVELSKIQEQADLLSVKMAKHIQSIQRMMELS